MLRLIGLYMHAGNKYVCSLNLLQHFDVKNKQTNEDLLLLHFLFLSSANNNSKSFRGQFTATKKFAQAQ